jgi:capsular exopolysaccharide synthesis family protein
MDMSPTHGEASRRDAQPDSRLIDLRGILAAIRRRRWWALLAVALVLAATAMAYLFTPKSYEASGTIALDRRTVELVATKDAPGLTTDSPTVDTTVQVLTSPRLAGEVVDSLGLASVQGFGLTDNGEGTTPDVARRRAIAVVRRGLTVKRTGVSYAISVAYRSGEPEIAARVANGIIDRYIAGQQGGREEERTRQTGLLRDRINGLRGEVIRAESAVARYRGASNLIDVDQNSTAVQQEISVLNTQLANAEADRAASQARLSALGGNGAAESPLLRDLRSQEAQLSAQRAGLAQRYGALHPDLRRIDQQLADVNRNIAAERVRVRSNLDADLRVASGRASAVRSSLSRAQGGLSAGNAASVQLNELERNAESARGLYQALLDRYRQAVAAQGTDQSDAYVISRAQVPGAPVSPNLGLFAIGGLVAALLAGSALVAVLEMAENGLRSRGEVEERLGVPVIGTVPDLASVPGGKAVRGDPMGPADFLIAKETSVFSEAFRSIRTALRIGQSGQIVRSLAITSALPNEGKTTTAICLARSVALAGGRVVLVDCDARQRASSRQMAGQALVGLGDVLADGMTLDRALLRDEASGAFILAQTGQRAHESDLLTSEAMAKLIGELEERFDLVILDTAPVLALAEARAIAGMADGVLLVTRWRRTPANATALAVDLLGRAGADVKGAALTMVDLRVQARSGLGDEMMYYDKFKKYYA